MAKQGKKHRVQVYGTYRFMNKDPIIDRVHTSISDSKMSYIEIRDKSGVATSTIYNWIHGGTKRPQFATVMAVFRACGITLVEAPYKENGK